LWHLLEKGIVTDLCDCTQLSCYIILSSELLITNERKRYTENKEYKRKI
jgi:hypothetical protein